MMGELHYRLRLEVGGNAADGGGGSVTTWSLVAEVWGAIRETGGDEIVAAEALQGRRRVEIWIRFRPDVTPSHRIVSGDRIFDVKATADPDGRRRWLRCTVEERLG